MQQFLGVLFGILVWKKKSFFLSFLHNFHHFFFGQFNGSEIFHELTGESGILKWYFKVNYLRATFRKTFFVLICLICKHFVFVPKIWKKINFVSKYTVFVTNDAHICWNAYKVAAINLRHFRRMGTGNNFSLWFFQKFFILPFSRPNFMRI